MEDVFAGLPGAAPPQTTAQPAEQRSTHPAKQWAGAGSDPESRLTSLLPGEVDGTVRHPFKVVDRQQYLQMIKPFGSIAARTHGAPIALVNLSDVASIQNTVNRERLVAHLRDPYMNEGKRGSGHGGLIDRPVVVRLQGQLYLHDGNHRLTAAHLRGQTTAKVRLVDLDAPAAT